MGREGDRFTSPMKGVGGAARAQADIRKQLAGHTPNTSVLRFRSTVKRKKYEKRTNLTLT